MGIPPPQPDAQEAAGTLESAEATSIATGQFLHGSRERGDANHLAEPLRLPGPAEPEDDASRSRRQKAQQR